MAAVQVLQECGDAVDATVAATFAASVAQRANTGIGGHDMLMISVAKTGHVYCIDGSGSSGKLAMLDRLDPKQGRLPDEGPPEPTVPGLVEVLLRTSEQYEELSRAKLLEPAIALAEEGFVVAPYLASQLRSQKDRLSQFASTRHQWFRNGEPVAVGTPVRQPDLAGTLKRPRRLFFTKPKVAVDMCGRF